MTADPLSAAPASDIAIAIEDDRWGDANVIGRQIEAAIQAALSVVGGAGAPGVEVSVLLTNDTAIRRLNNDYRGIDKPTNVLSFGQDDLTMPSLDMGPRLLGDIVLAFETIHREAKAAGTPFMDHVSHLAVHGLLHLQEFDHQDDTQALEMERLECHILKLLDIPDPYLGNAPDRGKQPK